MEGKRRDSPPRRGPEKLYVAKKQDRPEWGGVSWPCFPAKHICRWNTDIGDRSSSRRPRSVRIPWSNKYIVFRNQERG